MLMFTPSDIRPLSIAIGSATAVGLALGLWLSLPSYLAQTTVTPEAEATNAQDPNLTRYQQMLVNEGVDPTPRVPLAGVYPVAETTTAAPAEDDDPVIVATAAQDDPPAPEPLHAERIAFDQTAATGGDDPRPSVVQDAGVVRADSPAAPAADTTAQAPTAAFASAQ